METTLLILKAVGVGFAGVILATLIKAQKYVTSPSTFVWSRFIQENKLAWIWCAVIVLLTAIIVSFVPDTAPAIKALFGIDFSGSIGSYLVLGIGLSALAKKKKGITP